MSLPQSDSSSSLVDETALVEVFAKHEARLLAMLQRRIDPALARRVAAGEILSKTFFAAQRKWSAFREKKAMSTYAWLYGVAMDCYIERWRFETRGRRDPAREIPLPESSAQLGIGLVCSDTGPTTALARKDMQARMRQTMELLDPSDMAILWMRAADGLSFAEIGAILRVKENAACVRYSRALDRLREKWTTLYPNEGPG